MKSKDKNSNKTESNDEKKNKGSNQSGRRNSRNNNAQRNSSERKGGRGNKSSRNNSASDQRTNKREGIEDKKSSERNPQDRKEDSRGIPWSNEYWYYSIDDQLAQDIASLPYNLLAGIPANLDYEYGPVSKRRFKTNYIGSIGIINYCNTPGKATNRTAGVNMAAVQLYTYIRHANSGAKNYEAADLMMYILEMVDIYTTACEIRRALGIAKSFPIVNKALPDALLRSLGIDPGDLRSNYAQYRAKFNLLISKMNSFAVPDYFKVFLRKKYIAGNVFADSTSMRGQFYAYVRNYYYVWDTTTSELGTQLTAKLVNASGAPQTLNALLSILEEQLNSMFLDTDAITMSGDILKAFPEAQLLQMTVVTTDEALEPILSEDALAQIENLVAADANQTLHFDWTSTAVYSSFNVTQQDQIITFDPELKSANAATPLYVLTQYLFNSHKDKPDYKDNLEWSRCMTLPVVTQTASTSKPNVCRFFFGCEFIQHLALYTFNASGDGALDKFDVYQFTSTAQDHVLPILETFDWHPFVYFTTGLGAQNESISVCGDLKFYTKVDRDIIAQMHDVANASVFYYGGSYNKAATDVKR